MDDERFSFDEVSMEGILCCYKSKMILKNIKHNE